MLLRTGSAGSNTVSDHITVLTEAIAALPARHRRDLLITLDGAGACHGVVNHITTLNAPPRRQVHYCLGWDLEERERAAIARIPTSAWDAVLDAQGQPPNPREAGVVALTGLLLERAALPPAGRARIGSATRVLECLDFEIEVFTNLVTGRLREDPGYWAIQAISGVGQILAAVFVAEIGGRRTLPPAQPS